MPKAIHTPTTSRRGLLAGSGVGAILAVVGAPAAVATPAAAHPDATPLAACQAYVDFVLAQRARDAAMTEAELQEAYKGASMKAFLGEDRPGDAMATQIAAIRAKTLDGQKAKARALRFYYGGSDDLDPFGWRGVDDLLSSVIADVLHGSAVA